MGLIIALSRPLVLVASQVLLLPMSIIVIVQLAEMVLHAIAIIPIQLLLLVLTQAPAKLQVISALRVGGYQLMQSIQPLKTPILPELL